MTHFLRCLAVASDVVTLVGAAVTFTCFVLWAMGW